MSAWLSMLLVGLGTYGTRLSFILLFGRRDIPAVVRRALRYVPPAVLTAIIFPELLLPAGEFDLSLSNERLIAGLIAALVAWRSKNVLLTIIAGMAVLVLLLAAGG
jgi:branched-subunit amino acid transport protein